MLSTRTSLVNDLMFFKVNRTFDELVVTFALVVIIRTFLTFEFFDKILINVMFIALGIETLLKLAIA